MLCTPTHVLLGSLLLPLPVPHLPEGQTGVPGLRESTLQELGPAPRPGQAEVLVVDVDGAPFTLDLLPYSLRSKDFRLIEVANGVAVEREAPPVATYRGEVYGPDGELVEGARALASADPDGWSLALDLPGRQRVLAQPLRELSPGAPAGSLSVVFDADDVEPEGPFTCGVEDLATSSTSIGPVEKDDSPPTAQLLTGNRITEIAIDTDVEFYRANGYSVSATLRDIERVMNLVEDAYETYDSITYEITTVVVRTGPLDSDPYSSTSPGTLLSQFGSEWSKAAYSSVRRDVQHLMTDKDLDGSVIGIAYLSVICNPGTGLSQSRFSSSMNSRAGLTAHELGHNWSAAHCDGNSPCHIMCSALGGCDGLGDPIIFGKSARMQINPYRDTRPCLVNEPNYRTLPFYEGWASDMTILTPWWIFADGVEVGDLATGEPSPGYSALLNSTGTGLGEQDDLRSHFIDTAGATDHAISFFTEHVGVEAGEDLVVEVRNVVDDFWQVLARIPSDGVDQTAFEYHEYPLSASLQHDHFRLRFRVESDETNDHWFVDNILVHDGPNLAQQPLARGAVAQTDLYGLAPGQTGLFLASLTGGYALGSGMGPSFFGGALVLDLAAPLFNLGFAAADAQGVAHRPVFIPLSLAPGTQVFTQAVRLEASLADSTTSNVIAQTLP